MSKAAIIMENTQSRVIQLSTSDFYLLREKVLWFDQKAFSMASNWVKRNNPESFKMYMIDENGFFPTGIVIRVKCHLEARGISVDIFDNRVIPKTNTETFRMKCKEPPAYSDQTDCTSALLKAGQGIAQVPTGVGKTRIIKDNIQQMGLRTLVITPSTNLKEQAAEYLEDCFGAENVGVFDKKRDLKPITVINYHSLPKTDPRIWKDHHLVQFDEFHNATNNTIRALNTTHLNSFYFRHGLTATNFTATHDDAILLQSVLSQTVFSMSIREAILKKYILPVMPIFIELENSGIVSKKDYREDYKHFMDNNEEKNQIIEHLIQKMKSQGIPVLTLVKHIEHGRRLAGEGSVFLNGQDAKAKENLAQIERFNALEFGSIVGTDVIGEGVNTKACGAVINGKGGKSKKVLLQNIGRGIRTFKGQNIGFYFDFIDKGQKSLKAHSMTRLRTIESEFGVKVKILKDFTI